MSSSTASATTHPAYDHHDPGCLEILVERLRENPGVMSVEVDFNDSTLTVRYDPAHVSPESLNALADEVGAVFSQRVTYCENRSSVGW